MVCSIFLVPLVIAQTHTAMMTRRLKAAEPTIVDGPSAPALKSPRVISLTLSRISGADEPSAIRERLATTGFLRGVCILSLDRQRIHDTEPTEVEACDPSHRRAPASASREVRQGEH